MHNSTTAAPPALVSTTTTTTAPSQQYSSTSASTSWSPASTLTPGHTAPPDGSSNIDLAIHVGIGAACLMVILIVAYIGRYFYRKHEARFREEHAEHLPVAQEGEAAASPLMQYYQLTRGGGGRRGGGGAPSAAQPGSPPIVAASYSTMN
jgi:hypothetical protein